MSPRNRTAQPGPDHTAADSEALAAYVLNALEPEKQLAMRQHLQDCDICYLEYTSLGVLPGLLDSLSLEDIRELTGAGLEQPAAVTGPERAVTSRARGAAVVPAAARAAGRRRVLGRDGRHRLRSRLRRHGSADGAPRRDGEAGVGGVGGGAVDASAATVVLTVSAEPLPEEQTALDVEVRSPRPLRECVLEVTTDDGARIEACHWSGTPSTRVVFSGDIPLASARLRAVAVLSADGTVLARQELVSDQS